MDNLDNKFKFCPRCNAPCFITERLCPRCAKRRIKISFTSLFFVLTVETLILATSVRLNIALLQTRTPMHSQHPIPSIKRNQRFDLSVQTLDTYLSASDTPQSVLLQWGLPAAFVHAGKDRHPRLLYRGRDGILRLDFPDGRIHR